MSERYALKRDRDEELTSRRIPSKEFRNQK